MVREKFIYGGGPLYGLPMTSQLWVTLKTLGIETTGGDVDG